MVPQRVYRSAMAFAVMIWCLHWAIHMSCDLPTPKNLKTARRSLSKVRGVAGGGIHRSRVNVYVHTHQP